MCSQEFFTEKLSHKLWLLDPNWDSIKLLGNKKRNIKKLIENIEKNIRTHHFVESANFISLGLYFYQEEFTGQIKKKGVLRSSKYHFRAKIIKKVCKFLLENKGVVGLSESSEEYFSTILRCCKLARAAEKKNNHIVSYLKKHKEENWLELLLLQAEFLFLSKSPRWLWDKREKVDYSREEVVMGISFLISELPKHIQEKSFSHHIIKHRGKNLDDILILCCELRWFRELEVKIDYFNYMLEQEGATFSVDSPGDLEREIQGGYIQNTMQQDLLGYQFYLDMDAPSIASFFSDELVMVFTEIKNDPVERVVFRFPAAPEVQELFHSLLYDIRFAEELALLSISCRELHCTSQELHDFEIANNTTLHDVAIVWKLFSIIRYVVSRRLEIEGNPSMAYNSIVLSFNEGGLPNLLAFFVGEETAQHVYTLLSSDLQDSPFIDVFSKPIIGLKDYGDYLALNTFTFSNFYSNIMRAEQKRLFEGGAIDPLSTRLANSLVENGFYVQTEVDFANGDIDLLAIKENHIFIFECKNSLFPTNTFELRTSFDCIVKGASQLQKIQKLVENESLLITLGERLECDIPDDAVVSYCIVTGNRMFRYHVENRFPVRNIHELNNFISSGIVSVLEIGDGHTEVRENISLRNEGPLTISDFKNYIENGIPLAHFDEKLIEDERIRYFGNVRIKEARWGVPLESARIAN